MIAQWIIRTGLILTIATSVSYAKNGKEMAVKEINPICTTDECKKIAKMYIDGMNEKADPCDNFFEYACGNWPKLHPIPKDQDKIKAEDIMISEAFIKVKELLEESKRSPDPEIEHAKKMYKACASAKHFYQRSLSTTVEADMKSVGNFPIFMPAPQKLSDGIKWPIINQQYAKLIGETSFFDIVLTYTEDDVKPMLELTYPESLYGMVIPSELWAIDNQESYTNFLVNLITNVKPVSTGVSNDSIIRNVKAVINFREKIIRIIENDRNWNKATERKKLGELQKWYNQKMKGKANTEFDWLQQIRSLYTDEWAKIIVEDTVLDAPMKYLKKLSNFLSMQSKETIVNHIHIYFAERALELNDELWQLVSTVNKKLEYSSCTTRYENERWKKCIESHKMPKTVETMYLDSDAFSPDIKSTIENMFEEMQGIMQIQIGESFWLSDEAKRKAIAKVDRMTAWIGYPPWHNNITLKDSPIYKEDVYVLDVNAQYIKDQNRIYVGAPYLRPPIYDTNWPYVLYYGSSYSMLGHEMYHAFTDIAINKNEKGETDFKWWPKNMVPGMSERRTCFTELYDIYKKKAYKDLLLFVDPDVAVPELTQSEDIADAMGLKAAYNGFKMKLHRSGGNCTVPLGFEKKWDKGICGKLFFLSYANSFCVHMSPRFIVEQLQDKHSVPTMRIQVPLANMEEFNRAFECKHDAYLNAPKKCDLWK